MKHVVAALSPPAKTLMVVAKRPDTSRPDTPAWSECAKNHGNTLSVVIVPFGNMALLGMSGLSS